MKKVKNPTGKDMPMLNQKTMTGKAKASMAKKTPKIKGQK